LIKTTLPGSRYVGGSVVEVVEDEVVEDDVVVGRAKRCP
jgi:hypothetical protein